MPIDHSSFAGNVFPKDVVQQVLALGLEGAPVFTSLTQRTTSRGSVAFPTGDPSGFGWVAELGEIPSVIPGADSAVAVLTKIAGLLLISNESIADADLPLQSEVGRLIAGSMAATADRDLLYGTVESDGPAGPAGAFDALEVAVGDNLRAAVVDACSGIMSHGGTPTTVLLSPNLWGDEMTRREATPTAVGPLFQDLGLPGLEVKVAATLESTDALVLDKTGCFALIASDYSIEASGETAEAWSHDGVSLRIKARLALAIPTPARSARTIQFLSS